MCQQENDDFFDWSSQNKQVVWKLYKILSCLIMLHMLLFQSSRNCMVLRKWLSMICFWYMYIRSLSVDLFLGLCYVNLRKITYLSGFMVIVKI